MWSRSSTHRNGASTRRFFTICPQQLTTSKGGTSTLCQLYLRLRYVNFICGTNIVIVMLYCTIVISVAQLELLARTSQSGAHWITWRFGHLVNRMIIYCNFNLFRRRRRRQNATGEGLSGSVDWHPTSPKKPSNRTPWKKTSVLLVDMRLRWQAPSAGAARNWSTRRCRILPGNWFCNLDTKPS